LDMTHTRLFTFRSFRRLFLQNGFDVLSTSGIPGPYPLALGDNSFARFLTSLNQVAIRIAKGLFAYQIFLVTQPLPTLPYLLEQATKQSRRRAEGA
jgi:hypothetical protein